ncbi:hypothetical protein [Mycobacterium sp. TY813]|uniref:hypothetical protein n=1 Tax=Mycobacterium TaxID=1763 RepID=UPI0027427DE5|nr:hypothetical protein [Mycobacterium sp. TY813]MDP7729496.1 hypothetical protein [Mycobacterium sp. TY813]
MARRQISEHFAIDFGSTNPEWRNMRNSAGTDAWLERVGQETVARCNEDLHEAQEQRKQPAEDGYDFHITHGSRSRLHIFPTTPRAIAHEAVNQAILKNLPMGAAAEHTREPDHSIPAELARRSNEAQGHSIHDDGAADLP